MLDTVADILNYAFILQFSPDVEFLFTFVAHIVSYFFALFFSAMPMLIPPVLPAGINLAIAKWTKGQGPRLLRFGSEAVLAPLVLAPLIAPPSSLNLDAWRDELSDFEEREPLLQWLEDGFPTLSTCAPVTLLARNHGSFFQHQAS